MATKIKVQILSDLHLEFVRQGATKFAESLLTPSDVLVVAGDLGVLADWQPLCDVIEVFTQNYPHVIWVPGNHEYYKWNFQDADAFLRDVSCFYDNLHVLNRCIVQLYGRKFVGTTLWFTENADSVSRKHILSDFGEIADSDDVFERANEDLRFLERQITYDSVVVTHHLPTVQSVAEEFKTSVANCYFVNYRAEWLPIWPKLWIHGHTHRSCDHQSIPGTRVISNPYGYHDNDVNPRFIKHLVVEI